MTNRKTGFLLCLLLVCVSLALSQAESETAAQSTKQRTKASAEQRTTNEEVNLLRGNLIAYLEKLARNVLTLDAAMDRARVMALAKIGMELSRRNDNRSDEVLTEAEILAGQAEPSLTLANALLGIASAYHIKRDASRAFEALEMAIRVIRSSLINSI